MNDPVLALGLLAFGLLLLVLPLSFWALSGDRNSPWVRLLVAAANLCLTAQLVLRWWESGHFPISNLYESLCFLAWGCTLVQLLVERSWPSPLVPAAATPMALGCVAFASFALPERLQEASPLVPALRSSWLVMHVSVIMLSYAALLVGSLLSVAVLLVDREGELELRSSSIGSGGGTDGSKLSRTTACPVRRRACATIFRLICPPMRNTTAVPFATGTAMVMSPST